MVGGGGTMGTEKLCLEMLVSRTLLAMFVVETVANLAPCGIEGRLAGVMSHEVLGLAVLELE